MWDWCTQFRTRLCEFPLTAPRGQNCSSDIKTFFVCFTVDGALSSLTNWTICSTTCGAGTQFRSRRCEFPITAPRRQNCYSESMTFNIVLQLMGCGVGCPTGQYAVQHVGMRHSSERGSVSFPSQLNVDKTVPLIS